MSNAYSSPIIPPVRARCYIRKVSGGTIQTNGESSGWQFDPNLRAEEVRLESKARIGWARISYIPTTESKQGFDQMLAGYSTDDQVKIVADPPEDEGFDQPLNSGSGQDGILLFTGILSRHLFNIHSGGDSVIEQAGFMAQPMPKLDNDMYAHLIVGRAYMFDPENFSWGVIESPSMPAVFNYRGRRNRSADETIKTAGGLEAPLFTHDDDPDGKYWTARDMMAHLIGVWLYGDANSKHDRNVCLSSAAAVELSRSSDSVEEDSSGRDDRWAGLDSKMLEIPIHGLRVLDALEAVCLACGFDFAIRPKRSGENGDRDWVLDIWRLNHGEIIEFDLAKRGTKYGNPATALKSNNVARLNGMRDASEIVNQVLCVGRSFIECRIELKPLWNPNDESEDDIDQIPDKITPEELDGSPGSGDGGEGGTPRTYVKRHVSGGSQYSKYHHVGRAWGVDCVGGFHGYQEGPYQHDPNERPFDWLKVLGIKTDGSFEIARKKAGIDKDKYPIQWSNRVRRILPMRSPEAVQSGMPFLLEVSENMVAGVGTWRTCIAPFHTLREHCGIYFEIPDLAAVKNESFYNGGKAYADESWWQMIRENWKLRFRITCCIEADSAIMGLAAYDKNSGSRYVRGMYLHSDIEETWVQPGTVFNNFSTFNRVITSQRVVPEIPESPGGGAVEQNEAEQDNVSEHYTTSILNPAQRERDRLEDVRISMSMNTFLMDMDRYKIGQRVKRIAGRNFSLKQNRGQEETYPNIVGISIKLGSVAAQAIEIQLEDQAFAPVR